MRPSARSRRVTRKSGKRRLSGYEHDRRDGGRKDRQQDEPGAYARTVVPPRAPA
jgi:hypothetical protein